MNFNKCFSMFSKYFNSKFLLNSSKIMKYSLLGYISYNSLNNITFCNDELIEKELCSINDL